MISSTSDLYFAIGFLLLLPPIIWVNVSNRRGLTGYVWRESPNLARVALVFLGLLWLSTGVELAAHFGLIAAPTAQALTIAIGVPMFLLSLAVLIMAGMLLARYLRTRQRV